MELKDVEAAAINTRSQLVSAARPLGHAAVGAADAADQMIERLMQHLRAQEARLQALERRLQ